MRNNKSLRFAQCVTVFTKHASFLYPCDNYRNVLMTGSFRSYFVNLMLANGLESFPSIKHDSPIAIMRSCIERPQNPTQVTSFIQDDDFFSSLL
jgi:hypothetical protein